MARVTKPCPECGGTDSIRDTPTGICRKCKRLIAFAKQRMADDAKRDGDEVLVFTRERSYALPGYYPKVGQSPHHKHQERLHKALHAAIMAQARPSDLSRYPSSEQAKDAIRVPQPPKDCTSSDWGCYVIMRKDQAEAMIELELAMREFIEATAAASYEEGQNLLFSIASGKMSINEINKRTIKGG